MTLNTKRSIGIKAIATPGSKFHCISFYGPPFSCYWPFWYKCIEWPQTDLSTKRSKVPNIRNTDTPKSQISPRFTLQLTISEILAFLFYFSIGTMLNFSCSENFKYKISKFQESSFVCIKLLQATFRKRLVKKESKLKQEEQFEIFTPIVSHVNENKKIIKIQNLEKKWNKRSMNLGGLLDTCNWCDKRQFSTDLFHSKIWPTKLLYKI